MSVTQRTRFLIFQCDDHRCQMRGKAAPDGARLEVDHKLACANGGTDEITNLWLLCYECNRGKAALYLEVEKLYVNNPDNLLKKYRGLRGITVRELAEKTGMNHKVISFIENDRQKATIVSIGKLAKGLDINIEELIPLMDTTAAERGRKGGTATKN